MKLYGCSQGTAGPCCKQAREDMIFLKFGCTIFMARLTAFESRLIILNRDNLHFTSRNTEYGMPIKYMVKV